MPDLPEQTLPLAAVQALEEYHAVGPEGYPGDIRGGVLAEWREALAGAELTPSQKLQRGWMEAEHGLNTLQNWYSRRSNNIKGNQIVPSTVQTHLRAANETFEGIVQSDEASNLLKAQAHVAIGSLPLWVARQSPLRPSSNAAHNLLYQTRAAAEVHAHLQHTQHLSPPKLAFCWSLGVMLVVNGAKDNDDTRLLSLPPRFYENQSNPDTWWQTLGCRFHDNMEMPLRFSLTSGDRHQVNVLPPCPRRPEELDDPDRLLLVRAVAKMAVGEALSEPEEITLSHAMKWAAGFIGRKARPVLGLPSLQPAQPAPAPEIAVTELPGSKARPLSLEGVMASDLFSWYRQQTNGRLLTSVEGQTLQGLLYEIKTQPTEAQDILALNRLRLECAIAYPANAEEHLSAARQSLAELEQELTAACRKGSGDIVELYETALEIERIKMYEIILSARPIDAETRQELCDNLTGLLCEINAQAKRTGNKRTRDLAQFVRPLLHSVLLMRQEQPHLAIPSLPRQLGNDDAPGWTINVWQLHANEKVTVGELRKLRLDLAGKSLVREGDIAVLPVPLVEKNFAWLQKLDEAGRGNNKSDRAQAILNEWQRRPFDFYRKALQALTPQTKP